MHVQWDVSVTALVTWAVMVGTAVFTVGRITQLLSTLSKDQEDHKKDFKDHQQDFKSHVADDRLSFQRIDDKLIQLLQGETH